MGRQINFYLHPDDLIDFEQILKSYGDIVILPYYHYDNKVRTIQDTIPDDAKKEGNRVYIVRQPDFKDIRLEHIEKFGYWLINDNQLPVLHYDRCIFENGKIIRGRLYFQPQYVKEMQWVNKSEAFVNWADNIIRLARRKLKKYKIDNGGWFYSEYVGKNTKTWLDNSKLEFGKSASDLISQF